MVRVKICGVTNGDDLRVVARAGADAVGIITDVSVDTPRDVSLERAATLVDAAPPFLTTTLVTMPETVAEAVETAEAVRPDVLQVHGGFAPGEFRSLRESIPAKVVGVVDAEAPERVRAVAPAVDAVLVDSVDGAGAGGTGETHDWDATAEVVATVETPVILAGGLAPENVAEAVRTVRPFAVDVASGVERTGGRKDRDAVRRFVANAVAAADGVDGSETLEGAPEEVPS
ncbi:N-(5'-phosphoribosyl)anthranilate isomerase [Halobellus salinus]|uniref:N-(5'-phosphoribosyl)anthranilate isomerase n=1 Tax=Halobellus salinus TaxID=931585 RepID=A0A830ECD9_9EURY|nr:phosphoribosylanthranilate isomerase [Halobellus salinus]GGI98108.1 N-(5'-phosphoribosyl)anthranilate isomerase [Halobellus salinus]SMP06609.1 phosphoribosylanthranilate isomerase [Halobellus salinus]